MSLSRRCQSWASCSWRGQNPDDLQDADEHVHQGGDERPHELTALQSFNERATITKLSAFGTWESISISPFFLKRQWLRIHSVHKTSDQWLLAVAIVSRPPPSVDNVSRELLCRRKMSLPDTVLFWFRSQIAQLSFHIDNKEMVLFPKSCDLRSKPSSRERERGRGGEIQMLVVIAAHWTWAWRDLCLTDLAPFWEPQGWVGLIATGLPS